LSSFTCFTASEKQIKDVKNITIVIVLGALIESELNSSDSEPAKKNYFTNWLL